MHTDIVTREEGQKLINIGKELHGKSRLTLVAMICLAMLILPASLGATLTKLTVDEYIFNSIPPTDSDKLEAEVWMDQISATKLEIVLINTCLEEVSSDAANNLVTGLGFYMDGLSINTVNPGDVNMGASDAINFLKPGDGDVSGEWGYANTATGPFQDVAYGTVNIVVSSMVSTTTDMFDPLGSITDPEGLNGPAYGLLSGNVDSDTAGGLEAIQDRTTFTLNLNGTLPGNWFDLINGGDVVVSFGSPNTSTVPEPATMLLLGSGLIGLAGLGRKRFRKG